MSKGSGFEASLTNTYLTGRSKDQKTENRRVILSLSPDVVLDLMAVYRQTTPSAQRSPRLA
jgi:hypothetical protein